MTVSLHDDPFAHPEVPRDRWKRPLIVPLDGDGHPDLTAKLVPYTRASSLPDKLEDKTAIGNWKLRVAALGIARDRSIYQRIASLAGFEDPLNTRKSELQAVMDRAFEMGGGSSAAESGTAFHELSEIADNGGSIAVGSLPPELANALHAYLEATKQFKVLDTELFAVNDDLRAAGTMDGLYLCPDGKVRVGDKKTGSDHKFPNKVHAQLATYANAKRYNTVTGERAPLHEDLDLDTGLLISVSLQAGTCDIYEVDLRVGLERARLAAAVRDLPSITKLRRFAAEEIPLFPTITKDGE